jgi:hypothetical protein
MRSISLNLMAHGAVFAGPTLKSTFVATTTSKEAGMPSIVVKYPLPERRTPLRISIYYHEEEDPRWLRECSLRYWTIASFVEVQPSQRIGSSTKVLGFASVLNVIEKLTICTHGTRESRNNTSKNDI